MNGLIFICVCITTGKLLSQLTNPQELIRSLNLIVIRVALPALILDKIHAIDLTGDALLPVITPWIGFIVTAVAIYLIRLLIPFSKVTTGCLILICGTSNTSFVGFPLIQALLGNSALDTAVIVDQSNLILLFTVGILVANLYSGHSVNIKQMLIRIITYPPIVALICGLTLRAIPYPETVQYTLSTFGSLLTPLTMISIGCSLMIPRDKSMLKLISIGLSIKLIVMPLTIMLFILYAFPTVPPLIASVTILQAGMAPMVTSVIIAADKNLHPELANFLTSLGIPISFITVVLWNIALPFSLGLGG